MPARSPSCTQPAAAAATGAAAAVAAARCLPPLAAALAGGLLAFSPGSHPAYPAKFGGLHILAYLFAACCAYWSHRLRAEDGLSRRRACADLLPWGPGLNFGAAGDLLVGAGLADRQKGGEDFLLGDLSKLTARGEASRVLRVTSWASLLAFFAVRCGFASAPYSPMWRTTCAEFDEADARRLADAISFERGFHGPPWLVDEGGAGRRAGFRGGQAPRGQLVPDAGPAPAAAGSVCFAFTTSPRAQHYLTQAVVSLLEGLAADRSFPLAGPVLLVTSGAHPEAELLAARLAPAVRLQRVSVPPPPPSTEKWHETWDYVRTLEACLNTTAGYALVLEDDVISGPHIADKLLESVQQLEARRAGRWLSLRLWASDKFQGWGSDGKTLAQLATVSVLGGFITAVLICLVVGAKSPSAKLVAWVVLSVDVVILCQAAGRQYVVPAFEVGLSLDFAQGAAGDAGGSGGAVGVVTGVAQLFPAERARDLLGYLRARAGQDPPDNLVREYAEEHGPRGNASGQGGLEQWMLWPPLVQHVGRVSSVGHTGRDWSCQGFPLATSFSGRGGSTLD